MSVNFNVGDKVKFKTLDSFDEYYSVADMTDVNLDDVYEVIVRSDSGSVGLKNTRTGKQITKSDGIVFLFTNKRIIPYRQKIDWLAINAEFSKK